jgi:hypothetical protein
LRARFLTHTDQKGKQYTATESSINPVLQPPNEESHTNNTYISEEAQASLNNEKLTWNKDYSVTGRKQENPASLYPGQVDKNSTEFTKQFPFTPETITPSFRDSNFKDNEFQLEKERYQGLMGEPPGMRNFKFAGKNDLLNTNAELMPVIKVTIGRIEVRAVTQQASSTLAKTTPKPMMSLDDYLKKRNEGK